MLYMQLANYEDLETPCLLHATDGWPAMSTFEILQLSGKGSMTSPSLERHTDMLKVPPS